MSNLLNQGMIRSTEDLYNWIKEKLGDDYSWRVDAKFPQPMAHAFQAHWDGRICELYGRGYTFPEYLTFRKEKTMPDDLAQEIRLSEDGWFSLLDLLALIRLRLHPAPTEGQEKMAVNLHDKWHALIVENDVETWVTKQRKKRYAMEMAKREKRLKKLKKKAKEKLEKENPLFWKQLWPATEQKVIQKFNEKYKKP